MEGGNHFKEGTSMHQWVRRTAGCRSYPGQAPNEHLEIHWYPPLAQNLVPPSHAVPSVTTCQPALLGLDVLFLDG